MRDAKVYFLTLAVIFLMATAGTSAQAAPFCAQSSAGKKCFYTDALLCARASVDGKCSINSAEVDTLDADHGMHFCVVASSFGMQCIYSNEPECLRAATAVRGLCVNTKENANLVWQQKMEADRQKAEEAKKRQKAQQLKDEQSELDRRRNQEMNKPSH